MKISVALCAYNGGKYIGEQLASIAAQSRPPDELIVCDDGSTDDTLRVVRDFAEGSDFPVRLRVNEENLGSTKNFERAISLCGGDVIALADQDDVWRADKLEKTERAFAADARVGLVFSDGELVDENLRPLGQTLWQSIKFTEAERRIILADRALDFFLLRSVVTGATMAFRAQFKSFVLPIPVSFNQKDFVFIHDGWIALLLSAVARVAPVAEPLFEYRQHATQQVGALTLKTEPGEGGNFYEQVSDAARRKNPFAAQIEQMRAVRERLVANFDRYDLRTPLAKVEGRLAHLVARSSLPRSKARRLPVILREAATFRYFRYSSGVYSAVKDLLS